MLSIERHPERFEPNLSRVLARYRPFDPERAAQLTGRVLALSATEAEAALQQVLRGFSRRHRNLSRTLLSHYRQVAGLSPDADLASRAHQLLIGAYFTMEYSIEAAAFFNPSLVPAPDQAGLGPDQLRVILSFRAVGEGHISSLVFREALLSGGRFHFEPPSILVDPPESVSFSVPPQADLDILCQQAPLPPELVARLGAGYDEYSHAELLQWYNQLPLSERARWQARIDALDQGYELSFSLDTDLSERVIFPMLEHERNGIEDARFVQFKDGDRSTYYATYTAYDGRQIQPRLLQTDDFYRFRSLSLRGAGAVNKNLALFPRKVRDRYAMLARIDGVNNYLMFSDKLTQWDSPQLLSEPRELWELGNTGNCGSPLETDAGWLLITHGVGPMRQYVLGAILLAKDDPTRIKARLRHPLLMPQTDEREGYVPNVVYSCGSLLHSDRLYVPYGISDRAGAMMSMPLRDLLERMEPEA